MDVFNGLGVEVELTKDFNIVRESISRVGYAPRNEKTLYQSCHIFHKRGRYAIMHFKEMFAFDGKTTEITSGDVARRNTIVDLLTQWGLVRPINQAGDVPKSSLAQIMIVPSKDKQNWQFKQKYTLGSN